MTELSDDRFTLIDEVVLSCREVSVMKQIYLVMQRELRDEWKQSLQPGIRKSLAHLPDFYMEMHMKLEGNFLINALVSYLTPSETYKIWKKGHYMRIDFSIKGFTKTLVSILMFLYI